jgi:hypothetical protein
MTVRGQLVGKAKKEWKEWQENTVDKTCLEGRRSERRYRAEEQLISFGKTTYNAYSSIYSPARLWLYFEPRDQTSLELLAVRDEKDW